MLKRKLCEAVLQWELTCEGPLLIADGRYKQPDAESEQEKGKYPNKLFISRVAEKGLPGKQKLVDAGLLQLPYYVPGTSLRGPFRAQAERIIRTLALADAEPPKTACIPFISEEEAQKPDKSDSGAAEPEASPPSLASLKSCSRRLDETKAKKSPYSAVCPACKLFGCTATASRIEFTDSDIADKDGGTIRSVYRDMIGIDRFTGGVFSGANMRFHVLENTRFRTTITLTNFELWQLGLLAYVLRDFEEGLVPIGFGKTKGFGQVKGNITSIKLRYPNNPNILKTDQTLAHLGTMVSEQECEHYQLHKAEEGSFRMADLASDGVSSLSLYQHYKVNDKNKFWEHCANSFNDFMAALSESAETTS